MNVDFVQENGEEDGNPRLTGCLTGWETVVFEVEDLPEELSAEG